MIAAQRASKLLGDVEALQPNSAADHDWLAQDWIPRAVKAGLRFVALVTPAFQLDHAPIRLVGERLFGPLALESSTTGARRRPG